jgi:hypothetical protein
MFGLLSKGQTVGRLRPLGTLPRRARGQGGLTVRREQSEALWVGLPSGQEVAKHGRLSDGGIGTHGG